MTPDAGSVLSEGPVGSADPGPGPQALLGDLMERARQALAGRLSGQVGATLAADGTSGGHRGGPPNGLAVALGMDEATRQPVIRVCDARTGRPVREVSPAALLRAPGVRTR